MSVEKEVLDNWRTVIQKYLDANPGMSPYSLGQLAGVGRGCLEGILDGSREPYSKNAQRVAELVEKIKSGQKEIANVEDTTFTIPQLRAFLELLQAGGVTEITRAKLDQSLDWLESL